jgi:hypothetical protein
MNRLFSISFISQTVVSAILTLLVIWAIKKWQVPVLSSVANDI